MSERKFDWVRDNWRLNQFKLYPQKWLARRNNGIKTTPGAPNPQLVYYSTPPKFKVNDFGLSAAEKFKNDALFSANFTRSDRTSAIAGLQAELAAAKIKILTEHQALFDLFSSGAYASDKNFKSRVEKLRDSILDDGHSTTLWVAFQKYIDSEEIQKSNPIPFSRFKRVKTDKSHFVIVPEWVKSPSLDAEMQQAFENLTAMKAVVNPEKVSATDKFFEGIAKIGIVAIGGFVTGGAIAGIGVAAGSTTLSTLGGVIQAGSGIASLKDASVGKLTGAVVSKASDKLSAAIQAAPDKLGAAVTAKIDSTTRSAGVAVHNAVKSAGPNLTGIATAAVLDKNQQRSDAAAKAAQVNQAGVGLGTSGLLILLVVLTIGKKGVSGL